MPLVGGHERVLVVDDEPQVLGFVASQLRWLGYEVTAVATGADALLHLEAAAYDLLLTDVVLGNGVSGVQIAKRAKGLQPAIKVLLTSGYSEDVFEDHGRPGGSVQLLSKPYNRSALANAVRTALGSSTPDDQQGEGNLSAGNACPTPGSKPMPLGIHASASPDVRRSASA
jgi:CheY-like chemotaxis protein